MFKQFLWILILAILSVFSSCRAAEAVNDELPTENLIIYYSPDTGNEKLLKAAEKYGSNILYVYKNINGIAVTVPKGKTVSDAVKYYGKVKGVLSVTKDRKVQLD